MKRKPKNESGEFIYPDATLKDQVFSWLRANPKIKGKGKLKKMAKDLALNYKKYRGTLAQYSSRFSNESIFGAGPKCPNRHKVRIRATAPKCLDRREFPEVEEQAVKVGWTRSRNRNGELIWANNLVLGRVRWWKNGTVVAHIEKPQTVERRNKLLLYAFGTSLNPEQLPLILDKNIIVAFLQRFDMVEWHDVHKTPNGEKLPYMCIDDYVNLLGFRIKLGDLSHRDSVEVEFIKPRWVERSQEALEEFNSFLKQLAQPRGLPPDDRSVV